jgi:hypothetical protein
MTTTATPQRLTITSLDRDRFDQDGDLQDMNLEMAAVGLTSEPFDPLYGDDGSDAFDSATKAWNDEVIDPAIAEVLPALKAQAKAMLIEAIERRLPWAEPER